MSHSLSITNMPFSSIDYRLNPTFNYIMKIVNESHSIFKSYESFYKSFNSNFSLQDTSIINYVKFVNTNTQITTKNNTPEHLLMGLLHLKMYFEHFKYIVLDWDKYNRYELSKDQKEQQYIELCNFSKEIYELVNSNTYYTTLESIINIIYMNNIYCNNYQPDDVSVISTPSGSDDHITNEKVKIYDSHVSKVNKLWEQAEISSHYPIH